MGRAALPVLGRGGGCEPVGAGLHETAAEGSEARGLVAAGLHETAGEAAREVFGAANFLVAKLTDHCNLKCRYCHQDALTGKPVLMPFETFANAVRLILKPSRAPVVYVQFHGGEPLLCSDDFFREAVAFCERELASPERRVAFCIQTNLTRVSPEREAMLRELGIAISYSLDGPPAINDELRGGGKRVLSVWRRMRENGTEAGVICLVQPSNWDRMEEVLAFFQGEGILNVRFNLMVPDGRGRDVDTATAEKLFGAKKVILDHMLSTGGQGVIDSTLHNMMRRFARGSGAPSSEAYHGCESLYCQAGRSLFSVNPDGRFFACDRIAERPSWAMGNVNMPFGGAEREEVVRKRRAFHHKDDWWARCEGCDAKKICERSCSAYYVDDVDTREVECLYTLAMWEHFLSRKDEILAFVRREVRPIFIDEKAPLAGETEEVETIRALSADAAYNAVSLVDTLAANPRYRLLRRGEQHYVFLVRSGRLFEVDAVVAEIARYNGMLGPEAIGAALGGGMAPGALREALGNVRRQLPEILAPVSADVEREIVEHASHEASCGRGAA
ncbi:MAG: radical SAM protein [Polyangiaceae bacterium]